MPVRLAHVYTEQRPSGARRTLLVKSERGSTAITVRYLRAEQCYQVDMQFYAEPGNGLPNIKAVGLGDIPLLAMKDLRNSEWLRY